MSDSLRTSLYSRFNQRDTDELLSIWQENNRGDWSDLAFDVLREILQERLGEVPPQSEPTFERAAPDDAGDVSQERIDQLLADEEAPVFYNPREVLGLAKWLKRVAIGMVGVTIMASLVYLPSAYESLRSFSPMDSFPKTLVWGLTLLLVGGPTALQCALYYWGFRWLAFVLKMLMEMEFTSREAR